MISTLLHLKAGASSPSSFLDAVSMRNSFRTRSTSFHSSSLSLVWPSMRRCTSPTCPGWEQEGSRKHCMPKCMRMHEKAKQKMIENDRKWHSATQSKLATGWFFFPHVFPILRLSTSKRKNYASLSDWKPRAAPWVPLGGHSFRLPRQDWRCSNGWPPFPQGAGNLERLEVDPMRPEASDWEYHLQDTQCSLTMTHSRSPSLAFTYYFNATLYIYIYIIYVVQYYKNDRQRRRDCSGQFPGLPIRIY